MTPTKIVEYIQGEPREYWDITDINDSLRDNIVCTMGLLIDPNPEAACAGGIFFRALLEDLLDGSPLDWLPTGLVFYDGVSVQSLTSPQDYQDYVVRATGEVKEGLDGDEVGPDEFNKFLWDPDEVDMGSRRYWFSQSGSSYDDLDIRAEIREAFV